MQFREPASEINRQQFQLSWMIFTRKRASDHLNLEPAHLPLRSLRVNHHR